MRSLKPRNLTEYEEIGLSHTYNLADGHAHQEQSKAQELIVERLPDLFYEAQREKQESLEERFIQEFFALAHQASVQDSKLSLLNYSASAALDVIAKYLKRRNLAVGLIHPTFDNLAGLMRRAGVLVEPLDEERLRSSEIEAYLDTLAVKVIFLVCPNNPTGWVPDRAQFERIIEYCKHRGKLLIIDFCFRFFSPDLLGWDQYQLFLDADIDFLTIEDTGKTWPTLDLKVGITTCSKRILSAMHEIHAELLLNVSPFILKLLMSYLEDTRLRGIKQAIKNIVEVNRRILSDNLRGTMLAPVGSSHISVEWLAIQSGISAHELWNRLRKRGIYILPGSYFFWHRQEEGDRYVRIALMRPTALFQEAVSALRNALLDIGNS